jgi:WD40 repeat protein
VASPLGAEQNGVAISADGNELVYASGHSIVQRNLVSGRQTMLTASQPPTRVLMSADGTRVLVVADHELRIWTPADGQARTISVNAVPLAAAMDPAGDRAVIGYTNGTSSVWNLSTASRIAQFATNKPPANGQLDSEPLQVAISPDGALIATGDTNGQVRLRSVADARLIAHFVLESNPRPIAPTYPVGELRFVDAGRELLAMNYPQPLAADYQPPGVGVFIDVASGDVRSHLSSPAQSEAPYEPGMDVSPDGQFVLSGIEGFAPAGQPRGEDAVYDTTTGDKLADLSEAAPAVSQTGVTNLAVENAWSPSGTRLVTASTGIYPCDACGSLADLQAAAQLRIAWETPIGPHSTSPPGNPLG